MLRIYFAVVLGGLENVPENNNKGFGCQKVVLHQPEYAGPCVQGGALVDV